MKFFILLFFVSLLFGTASGITVSPSVTIYVHDLVLSLLFIAFLISRRKNYTRPKLLLPLLAFAGAAVMSLGTNVFRLTTPQLGMSFLYLVRWMFYAGLYLLIVQDVARGLYWLKLLFFSGVGFAVLGIAQYMLFPSLQSFIYLGWDPHYYRLFSTLLDPNFAGIIFTVSIFLGWFWFIRTKRSKFIMACLGFLLLALYLTYSRSSYIAFTAGALVLIFRSLKHRTLGIIAILLFLLAVVLVPKPGGDTLRLDRMASTISRFQNWQESVKRIGESPIFGFGFNTLRFVFPSGTVIDMKSKAASGVENSMLFVLLTTGIVGFLSYGWLFIRQIGEIKDNRERTLGSMYLASIAAVLVHSMFVNSLFYPWVMIWIWVLTGTIELTYDT